MDNLEDKQNEKMKSISIIGFLIGLFLVVLSVFVRENSDSSIEKNFANIIALNGCLVVIGFVFYEIRLIKKLLRDFYKKSINLNNKKLSLTKLFSISMFYKDGHFVPEFKFYLLFFITGGICFAWQPLLSRYISNMSGDMYMVHLSVLLGFIFFGAIGNILAIYYKKYLPYLEILTGAIMFSIAYFSGQIWDNSFVANFPILCSITVISLPGIILGMHVPFYASYLKSKGFSFGYAIYALGGVLVILGLEYYYFIEARYLSKIIMFFAVLQIVFGSILYLVCRLEIKNTVAKLQITSFIKGNKTSILKVFLFSVTSFIVYYWAMRSYAILVKPFRLQSSILLASSLSTVLIGSFISMIVQKLKIKFLKNNITIFALMITSMAFVIWFYAPFVHFLQHELDIRYPSIKILNFYLISLSLMVPCSLSTLFFANLTTDAMEKLSDNQNQIPSAIFLLMAAISNVVGIFVGVMSVNLLWESYFYFIIPFAVLPIIFILLSKNKIKNLIIFVFIVLISFFIIDKYNFLNRMLEARYHGRKTKVVNSVINEFSTILTLTQKKYEYENKEKERLAYFTNGYSSHDMNMMREYYIGKIASFYFDNKGPQKTLVVGIGSGQSTLAAGMLSGHTDIVDIDPGIPNALELTKEFNADLKNLQFIDIHIDDAFSYLKNTKEKYDVIIATQTSPSNYNANKLYTAEFLELAKKALNNDGIYVSYFFTPIIIENSYIADTILAPVRKQFKHVDIWANAYYLFVAYNKKPEEYNFDYQNNQNFKERKHVLEPWGLVNIFEEKQEYFGNTRQPIPLGLISEDLQQKKEPYGYNTMDYNIIEKLSVDHDSRFN